MVRRPAIYELKGGESLKDALDLAGGVMVSASLQQVDIERIEAHQRRTMLRVGLSNSSDMTNEHQAGPDVEQPAAKAIQNDSASSKAEKGNADSGGFSGNPESAGTAQVREAMAKLAGIPAQDGDRIVVLPILPYNEESVYLDGHVFRPGKYPYHEGMTINDLLRSYQDVIPEPADHAGAHSPQGSRLAGHHQPQSS